MSFAELRQPETSDLIPAIGHDGKLYPIEKLRAHREGVHHVAISVFLLCEDDLLVQQRAPGKYHSGGLWANTCCSHPAWNEAPELAAQRRLEEELGIKAPLRATRVIDYEADVGEGMREHERVHVFGGWAIDRKVRMRLNPSEVSRVRWLNIGDLKARANSSPERFAPWFRIYLQRWDELGL